MDRDLHKLVDGMGISGGVVKTHIPQAPVGAVTTWGNTTYMFRELSRQTFDPAQIRTVPVAVDTQLGAVSYETSGGEVFYRDRTKDVPAARYEEELDELKWAGAQILVEQGR